MPLFSLTILIFFQYLKNGYLKLTINASHSLTRPREPVLLLKFALYCLILKSENQEPVARNVVNLTNS